MADLPPGDPNPMTEIPILELEDLRRRAIPQDELEFFRATIDRLPSLEAAAGERNNLIAQLNDMSQERDRLKGLLLSVVPEMEAFSVDYPQATIARTAFAGGSPEEIAEKMAIWDAGRAQKTSEWNSLVNYVRTQATV